MSTAAGDVHYSGAETQAYKLGLDPVFVGYIRQERLDLTSPFPFTGGVKNLGLAVADAARGSSVSPGGQGISGQGITLS